MNLRCEKRVLFMGERIEDVYHYGRLMNRPAKEPIQCIELERTETFDGGIVAASAHARGFCESMKFRSDRSVTKARWLESAHGRKLFSCYEGTETWETNYPWETMPPALRPNIIAVCDYGHGMMTPDLVAVTEAQPAFLAACVQTNAGNYGFNLATKYHDLDYLCVDELEARLATQNQAGDIKQSLAQLSSIADTVVVTLGKEGAIGWRSGEIVHVPAYTDRVRDTMGAGDAFFAVTALFAEELTLTDLLRLGNAAAAVKTQHMGQRAVTRAEVEAILDFAR